MNKSALVPSTTVLALALMLGTSAASAQEGDWYGGLSLGKAWSDIDDGGIDAAVRASGSSLNTLNDDDSDTTWRLVGGYNFTDQLALEASYVDFGNFGFNAGLLPAATLRGDADVTGYGLDLVGTWPLGDRLAFLARIGITNTRVKQAFSGLPGSNSANDNDRGANANYGIGFEYAVNDNLALRTELTRFDIDSNRILDDNIDTLTLGLVYRFGSRAAPVAATVPETRPQTPPPAAAPALPVEVTLAANTLFDFDRSELKPEGRRALDELLQDMDGLTYDVVIITGHTDRIGTRNYNLALSERRAETVRAYLVQAGVPAASITARGVNSDVPVTTAQQCTGPVNDALKACLQPDRRVVVEVSGTREAE